MTLGFIGLGTMGLPMAQHLMRHGHPLGVWARRDATVEPLRAAGAMVYRSPAALAAASDVLFTMVTGTADVGDVLFGEDGAAQGARKGFLSIDMSTIAPSAARDFAHRLEARGADMLDAPVSGGPAGARDARLSIWAGGRPDVFERARPLFECLGTTILHMGDHGAGQAIKACHQLLLVITAQGSAEAISLAGRYGIDPSLAVRAMMSGVASSRVLDLFGTRMAARTFAPGIAVRLYRKDMKTVLEMAQALGARAPAGELALTHLEALTQQGREDDDLSALIDLVEQL